MYGDCRGFYVFLNGIKMNTKLAICIPTYNRSSVLDFLLSDLIPKVKVFSIPIYISDNASTDSTADVVLRRKQSYEYIFYTRNNVNVGADRNFEAVLKMSECDYSWLLGDDDIIIDGAIEDVLSAVSAKSYDMLVVNGSNRDNTKLKCNLKSNVYHDHNTLLVDLWYTMTWISTLIYSKKIIDNANYEKYYDTNFLQTTIIFEFLAVEKDFSVYWESRPLVTYPNEEDIVNHYNAKRLYLFIKCWNDSLEALPSVYSHKSKQYLAGKACGLKCLLRSKAEGFFGISEFYAYKKHLNKSLKIPDFVVFSIAVLPSFLFYFSYRFFLSFKFFK